MPVEQLAQPCWYARYDGGEERDNDIHYGGEAEARKVIADLEECDPGGENPEVEIGQFPAPCWTAQCNGPDGAHPLEEPEWEWTLHLESRTEAEGACREAGWIITRSGEVFCSDDAPECDRADLLVTEVPGQLSLTGEDGSDG